MKTYVIWDGSAVKVGHTSGEIAERIAQLQTGNPNKLVLVAWVDKLVESEMQKALRPHRMHKSGPGREWFDCYSCSRELSRLIVEHGMAFGPAWDQFRLAVVHNRGERRSGVAAPGHRSRAHAHGLRRSAGVIHKQVERFAIAQISLVESSADYADAMAHLISLFTNRRLARYGYIGPKNVRALIRNLNALGEYATSARKDADHCRDRLALFDQMDVSGFLVPAKPK